MASTTLITGNTYPVKEALKALGGRWDPAAKGWRVPSGRAEEALTLVGGVPAASRRSYASRSPRSGSFGRCWECGFTGRLNSDGECGRC